MQIIWTEYFKYRVKLREFHLERIEEILRYSTERYYDTSTDRLVVVGSDANIMIIVPYEQNEPDIIAPITVHATNRQQINYRIKSGRFRYE
jgi:hypothetical protein